METAIALCMENVRIGVVLLDIIIFIKGGASPDTVSVCMEKLDPFAWRI